MAKFFLEKFNIYNMIKYFFEKLKMKNHLGRGSPSNILQNLLIETSNICFKSI